MTPPEAMAYALATEAQAILLTGCSRVEIAGSLRRGSMTPKDIEIVCIPRVTALTRTDLFGGVTEVGQISGLDGALALLASVGWAFDAETKRNGPLYKRLMHPAGVPLDLFITDAAGWGVNFTLRTGPAEFSKLLVTRARAMKMHVTERRLHRHPVTSKGGADQACKKGAACPLIAETPEESDFFAALKLRYIEPAARTPKALWAADMARPR